MMKKLEPLFQEMNCSHAFWVTDFDREYLPRVADFIVQQDFSVLSAPSDFVELLWPWVESKNVKIITRFVIEAKSDFDSVVSEFAAKVSSVFRGGASGIQIFISPRALGDFVTALKPVRDDLFFDRFLSVGLSIDEIKVDMWDGVFGALQTLRPNAILITSDGDEFDRSSDFAGRVFTMLEKWDTDADLHLMFGKNTMKLIQTIRLVQKMRPDLMKKLTVFVRD